MSTTAAAARALTISRDGLAAPSFLDHHEEIETTCLEVCDFIGNDRRYRFHCEAMEVSAGNNICARSVDRLFTIYFFGATSCLRSFGWGCIPGGESRSGLDAGAPPEVVLVGPG